MAEFRDSLGRIVNGPEGFGSSEVKDLIKSLMSRPAKDVVDTSLDEERNETLEDIKDLLEKLHSSFASETADVADYIKEVADNTKAANSAAKKPKTDKTVTGFAKNIADIHKHLTKKSSDHDVYVERAIKDLTKALNNRGGIPYSGGGGMRGGGGGRGYGGDGGRRSNWRTAHDPMSRMKRQAFRATTGGMASMLGGASLTGMFTGAITQQTEFIRNMRQIGLQTTQITGETETIQKEWEGLDKTSKFTGKRRNEFEQQYLKNLKSGRVSQKETLKTTQTSLNLSTMIGSSTEQTADLLNDWHVKLQMNSGDVAEVSRGMQQVAHNTGVTGDKLVAAAASSQDFVKNMRDAGTLTTQATNAIIELQTRGQKMGVEGLMTPILKAISSTNALYNETSMGTKALVFQAAQLGGVMQELQNGTINNTQTGRAGFASGMKQLFERITGVGIDKIDTLGDAEKRNLNLILAQYGTSLNQMAVVNKELEDAAKSFGQKISDIKKDRNSDILTTQQSIHLRRKQQDLEIGKGFEMLNAMDKALTGAKSTEEAMSKINQAQLADWKKDFAAINISGDGSKFAAGVLKNTFKQMQAQAKANNVQMGITMSDIDKAIAGGPDMQKQLIQSLTSDQQQIATAIATNADPISKVEQRVKEVNDSINALSKRLVTYLMGVLGPAGTVALGAAYVGGLLDPVINAATGAMAASRTAGTLAAGSGQSVGTLGMIGRMFSGKTLAGLSKFAGGLAIVGTALAAAYGALEAGSYAADIFNTEQEKLTTTQVWAAEGAGLLTSALNFLTFGLFRDALGPTGTLTKTLAVLFDGFAPLAWAFQIILIPIKIFWGILKGLYYFIKEVLIGAWEGLMAIMQPFNEIFITVKEVFNDIASTFSGVGGIFGENIGIVETLVTVLSGLGKVLGWVLKVVGMLTGMLIRTFLLPLHVLLKAVGGAVKGLMYWLRPMMDGIIQFFSGIGGILTGLFSWDFEKVKNGFKDLLWGLGKFAISAIGGVFLSIPSMILTAFYDGLVAIPDLFMRYVIDPLQNLLSAITWGYVAPAEDRTKKALPPNVPKMAVGSAGIAGDGLAFLHKGEQVIPAKSVGPYTNSYRNDASMSPGQSASSIRHLAMEKKFYKSLSKTLKDSAYNANRFGSELLGALRNRDLKQSFTIVSKAASDLKKVAQPMIDMAKSGIMKYVAPIFKGAAGAVNYLKNTTLMQKTISGAKFLAEKAGLLATQAKGSKIGQGVANYASKGIDKAGTIASRTLDLAQKAKASTLAQKTIGGASWLGEKAMGIGGNVATGAKNTAGWLGNKALGAAGWAGGKMGLTGAGGLASKAMPWLGRGARLAGKSMPFLSLIMGGATGFNEAADVGNGMFKGEGLAGKAESTLLGALTGSADSGSIAGDMGLVAKHGAADKALGVAGAAGGGALTGAAIGTMIAPGIGTAIGGALGGVIGGGAELWKLFWEEAPKDITPKAKMTTSPPVNAAQQRMAVEQAASQPAFAEVGSDELSTIATNSDEQTLLTARMVSLLSAIERNLQINVSPEQVASNPSTSKPGAPADYYPYPVGNYNQGANKGVTNMGIG